MASPAPRVWLVLGDKRGDNAQVEVLAAALGWPCERKRLALLPEWLTAKPRVEASLHHLDLARSDALEPPWPDLVLTIGRRPSMAALWIRKQSGGHTRVALLGKPSGALARFDLVIASSEAQLPPGPRVLRTALPLMRVDERELAAAADAWRARMAPLPRPLVAFLIGGPTSPFVYDTALVRRLAALAADVVAQGGTPWFTTSRRTPAAFVTALTAALPPGTRLHRFAPDAAEENPYRALLAQADGFVVSADSISMQVEVIRLRRPLAILPLPTGPLGALDARRRAFARWLFSERSESAGDRLRQALARALFRVGLVSQTRDFPAFHRELVARGLAVIAGTPFRPPSGAVPDDLAAAAARVRALVSPT